MSDLIIFRWNSKNKSPSERKKNDMLKDKPSTIRVAILANYLFLRFTAKFIEDKLGLKIESESN